MSPIWSSQVVAAVEAQPVEMKALVVAGLVVCLRVISLLHLEPHIQLRLVVVVIKIPLVQILYSAR